MPSAPKHTSAAGLDLSRTLTFFFEDPDWVQKLLVGSLFALLSPLLIGTVFIAGYAVALARNTMRGATPLLPEWDDLKEIFIDGLKGVAISLAHKLPVLLLIFMTCLALFGGIFLHSGERTVPEEFLYFGLPVLLAGWLIVVVLSFAILVYVPAAFVRFIRTNRLGAAFDVMENIAFIRDHSAAYLTALLAILLASFIAQFGFIVFCIGIFPAFFWSACVMGYVIGELARLAGGEGSADGQKTRV